MTENPYKAFSLNNYRSIPQLQKLTSEEWFNMEVVGSVLPFKVNNYVIDELIDWGNYRTDPMFILTFPQKEMLLPEHFRRMAEILAQDPGKEAIKDAANTIRHQLNPHPAGQSSLNIPVIDGVKLTGVQHKYRETVLFFPSSGQTCHSYCTFCFRWPQFVGMDEMKFAMRETELLEQYLAKHTEVTDLLFTGGDPMIMGYKVFKQYIDPFLNNHLPHIRTIRIGTKVLSYWPYKFLTDKDADDFLRLFEQIVQRGINLAIMAHFNHPRELKTEALGKAIKRLRATGVQIRTQSPLLKNINDHPETWAEMWREQVNHNCIPYYMFVARDTGAQHYFEVPLYRAWDIFRHAYQKVSGVCRTVRGPSMSCTPGKVQVLGVSEIGTEKVFVLRFLQGRNPDWAARPFFARFDENAKWMSDLKPYGNDQFFFEEELEGIYKQKISDPEESSFE